MQNGVGHHWNASWQGTQATDPLTLCIRSQSYFEFSRHGTRACLTGEALSLRKHWLFSKLRNSCIEAGYTSYFSGDNPLFTETANGGEAGLGSEKGFEYKSSSKRKFCLTKTLGANETHLDLG